MANAQIFLTASKTSCKASATRSPRVSEFSGSVMFLYLFASFRFVFRAFLLEPASSASRSSSFCFISSYAAFSASVSSMFSSITKHANLPPFSRIFFLVFLLKNPVHPYFNSRFIASSICSCLASSFSRSSRFWRLYLFLANAFLMRSASSNSPAAVSLSILSSSSSSLSDSESKSLSGVSPSASTSTPHAFNSWSKRMIASRKTM
mmetsp:Transcript_4266/g.14006  ORF Transcript_4266/g.14006 Transcript_4266/m.14006 type:complete len:206 (-) Transcript_4266:4315-4932(-)